MLSDLTVCILSGLAFPLVFDLCHGRHSTEPPAAQTDKRRPSLHATTIEIMATNSSYEGNPSRVAYCSSAARYATWIKERRNGSRGQVERSKLAAVLKNASFKYSCERWSYSISVQLTLGITFSITFTFEKALIARQPPAA